MNKNTNKVERILCKGGCGVTIKNDGREYCVMCQPIESWSKIELDDLLEGAYCPDCGNGGNKRIHDFVSQVELQATQKGIEMGRGKVLEKAREMYHEWNGVSDVEEALSDLLSKFNNDK